MKVVYEGGAPLPNSLRLGATYTVRFHVNSARGRAYIFEEVEGEYNVNYFRVVEADFPKTYLGYSTEAPKIGFSYLCYRMECSAANGFRIVETRTSTVQKTELIGKDTYKITTINSIYIISIISA